MSPFSPAGKGKYVLKIYSMLGRRAISFLVCVLFAGTVLPSPEVSGMDCGTDSTRRAQISLQILFSRSSSEIDPSFDDNSTRINRFFAALDSLSATPGVHFDSSAMILSSASPEGLSTSNITLSQKRAEAIKDLCIQRGLSSLRFEVNSKGEDWQALSELLSTSELESREQAIRIITNTPRYIFKEGRIIGGRKKAAMELCYGRVWKQLDSLLFPSLRQATLILSYSVNPAEALALKSESDISASGHASTFLPLPAIKKPEALSISTPEKSSRSLFALKTNLLFDAASLINIGAEFPLGQRYSISSELYFPWWKNPQKDFTAQMMAASLEGRYYLGARSGKKPMTGFFAGVFLEGGVFDFQPGKLAGGRGVQSEYFLSTGLSAGYVHSISPSFRLEYSLGAGYLRSRIREYISVKDTKFGDIKVMQYPWDVKIVTGLVPARASVSLIWMIDSKREVRYE